MKVKINKDLCSGHGRCWIVASEFYELDNNGYNAKAGQTVEVPTHLEQAARLGAEKCPERAITIEE
ncbi:ferredoxin [Acidocella sp.]|uniref:ferredoxin n=1 Tax=Acidocella sp. TaxID=50710 RepID=UPI002606294B|nr:ferredoxin [Acidocella sp.]